MLDITPAEFIFGDSLSRAIGWIGMDAMLEHTPEAIRDARLMIRGIDRLLMCMGMNEPTTTIVIQNIQLMLLTLEHDLMDKRSSS